MSHGYSCLMQHALFNFSIIKGIFKMSSVVNLLVGVLDNYEYIFLIMYGKALYKILS